MMSLVDGNLMNGLQAMEQWQEALGHPKGPVLGAIRVSLFILSILQV